MSVTVHDLTVSLALTEALWVTVPPQAALHGKSTPLTCHTILFSVLVAFICWLSPAL